MMNQQFQKGNGYSRGGVMGFAAVALVFMFVFTLKSGWADTAGTNPPDEDGQMEFLMGVDDRFSDISFPTYNRSGIEACANDDGKPVIFLFSSASCAHCEWAGEIFDFIVRYYVASGQIEAHHYDVHTGDDLLTEEIETYIPPAHLQIKEHGDPEGLVPYFNFSCKYERIGNSSERGDDPVGEATEMRQVIETLIQVFSEAIE